MIDLDDGAAIERLDSLDVLGAAERFAEQCREGWALGRAARDLPGADGLQHVVVLGMGGSGISGDVLRAVVEPRLAVPVVTLKGYGPLPEWVGRNSLVFAVSYSGNTEETLAAFEQAHDRGARGVTVSSGGRLAELASMYGVTHVGVPTGLQPRASLGFLSLPLLAVLCGMELLPPLDDDVAEAVEVLGEVCRRCHRRTPVANNPAKSLAVRLSGRVPVVYGGEGIGAVAAYRFKCDLNEYAKVPAHWHYLPELDHNEIVGWSGLQELTRAHYCVVLLRDRCEHERIALRFDVTARLIAGSAADVVPVHSQGQGDLARLLSLIATTQFAAIYTGLARGVDPGPVEVIEALKAELSES